MTIYKKTRALLIAPFFMIFASEAKTRYLDFQATMCEVDEAVYISCSLDAELTPNDYSGAVASVCAKGNTSPDTGYVQFRYGLPGEPADFTYPLEKSPPRGRIKIYKTPDGRRSSLRFKNGEDVYAFEDYGLRGYRLIVTGGGREVTNKRCDDPGVTYIADGAYLGIEKSDSEFGP